jgi:hypothetical protein
VRNEKEAAQILRHRRIPHSKGQGRKKKESKYPGGIQVKDAQAKRTIERASRLGVLTSVEVESIRTVLTHRDANDEWEELQLLLAGNRYAKFHIIPGTIAQCPAGIQMTISLFDAIGTGTLSGRALSTTRQGALPSKLEH